MHNKAGTRMGRRQFVGSMVLGAAAVSAATPALAARLVLPANTGERMLRFHNIHTGEHLNVAYWSDGEYQVAQLLELNHLLRDHRENRSINMDVRLFDQLWLLQARLGGNEVFEVISGYRTPTSNKLLREFSTAVSRNSYHMQGRAIDIRLRGTRLEHLREVALAMQAGGVGYYRSSDFVHLDTGPVRSWS